MTIEELIARLDECRELSKGDPEAAHSRADDVLLLFIGNEAVTEAFDNIKKWYA